MNNSVCVCLCLWVRVPVCGTKTAPYLYRAWNRSFELTPNAFLYWFLPSLEKDREIYINCLIALYLCWCVGWWFFTCCIWVHKMEAWGIDCLAAKNLLHLPVDTDESNKIKCADMSSRFRSILRHLDQNASILLVSSLLQGVFKVSSDGPHLSATVNPAELSESSSKSSLTHYNEATIHLERLFRQKGMTGHFIQSRPEQFSQPLAAHLFVSLHLTCSFNWIEPLCIILMVFHSLHLL